MLSEDKGGDFNHINLKVSVFYIKKIHTLTIKNILGLHIQLGLNWKYSFRERHENREATLIEF